MTALKKLIHSILELLFPRKCFGCGINGFLICPKCLKEIPFPEFPQKDILAAASYKSPTIQNAIRTLKYRKSKIVAETLADLIYDNLKDKLLLEIKLTGGNSCIIAVPLSKKRLKQRGFNQAKLIAQYLSDKLNIPLANDVLYKNKETISQVQIKNREKRLKNLKGVFAIKNPLLIKDKTIFLVDDVSTTGATIEECRKTLMAAGAKKVIGMVVAKG